MQHVTRYLLFVVFAAGLAACDMAQSDFGQCEEGVDGLSGIGDITPAGC